MLTELYHPSNKSHRWGTGYLRGCTPKPFLSIKYNIAHNKQNKNAVYNCTYEPAKNAYRTQYIVMIYYVTVIPAGYT